MIEPKYTLIIRDSSEKRLGVVSTHREPRTGTGHNAASPQFLKFCRSVFAMWKLAESLDVVSLKGWSPGVDVETLSAVMWVRKSDELPGALAYNFPE